MANLIEPSQTFLLCDFERDHLPGNISCQLIAARLSKLCRYHGKTCKFYSVAEHCVHLSYQVPQQLALAALLHDAEEAFMGDIVQPVLNLVRTETDILEILAAKIRERVRTDLKLPITFRQDLKDVQIQDIKIRFLECEALIYDTVDPYPFFKCWLPTRAEEVFNLRYMALRKQETS